MILAWACPFNKLQGPRPDDLQLTITINIFE